MKSINPRYVYVIAAGMLGGAVAISSMAAPTLPGFKEADSNGDGMVSMVEFAAHGGQAQALHEADANSDSRLSHDEYIKAVASNDRIKAGKYIDDAMITAKVKAMLLKDDLVKGLAVNVETHKGTVQLSGWVDSPAQAARAETIALGVEGVKGVRNALQIKS